MRTISISISILAATITLLCTGVGSATAGSNTSELAGVATTITFLAPPNDLNDAIPANAPFAVRPATVLIFPHAGWVLDKLKWTGWGTASASGSGESIVLTCEPNCAAGGANRGHGQITVSSPGKFQGREVYRCFTLSTSNGPTPHHSEHGCINRKANFWFY